MSSLYNGQNGRTSNEPIVKSFVYSSRYNNSGVKPFSLIAKDGYQRMLMTQQRFKVTANGFVELNGSITVQLSKDTVFGVNPGIAQNYNPFSGNGKTRRRQLFKIEHKLPAGIHTIPLHAVAPVQFSTTTPDNVKRTNEVMAVVDVMRKEGYAKVLNMVLNVKFTPSHSHNAVQMFTSTGYGNQKSKHLNKSIQINQHRLMFVIRLLLKIRRFLNGRFEKEAKITVVDEPRLKPITDENIGFYNMDINTAVLTFQVRKQDYPLEISKVNTDIYAYFVSDNGSSTGRVQVDYVNPMQGIIQLTLDNDFLKAATDTYVTGQIYIKAVGRKDTVVLNEFRFYVKDALINQIDADIKISYIREIDDLIDNFKEKSKVFHKILAISKQRKLISLRL